MTLKPTAHPATATPLHRKIQKFMGPLLIEPEPIEQNLKEILFIFNE